MSEVTTGSAANAVVVDIEATIKAEVAKAIAAARAEESKLVTFVKAHYSKVIAAVIGFVLSHFGIIQELLKLI